MKDVPADSWPPIDSEGFIRSDRFGNKILQLSQVLQRSHHGLDFSDAVAYMFEWLDDKLVAEPDFFNAGRFPSESALWAYLRLALLRVALNQHRKTRRRSARQRPMDSQVFSTSPPPLALAIRDEMIDRLGYPCSEIVRRLLEGSDGDLSLLAGVIGLDPDEFERALEGCLDRLAADPDIHRLLRPRSRRGRAR